MATKKTTTKKAPVKKATNKKAPIKKKLPPKKSAAAAPARSRAVQVEVLPPVITVERRSMPMSRTPNALVTFDADKGYLQLGKSVVNLITDLPHMTDKRLQQLFVGSIEMERAAWVVKGAAAHEIVTRHMKEGSQFTKEKGMGLDTLINEIAKDIGVNGHTLRDDYKAFHEFGEYIKEQLTNVPEALMPREFYVLASKVGRDAKELPFTVLEYYQEQRESTGGDKFGYFTDHARRDLKLFNEGRTVDEVRKLDGEVRKAKVEAKKSTTATPAIVDHTMSVHITGSKQNQAWVRMIIEKYSSFTAWFEKTAEAEFGKVKG